MNRVELRDEADFVIVGTGAGGATAARVLTAAGHSVVLLEEGPYLRTADRPRDLLRAMAMSFRDFGTATTSGMTPMPLLQGRCVGGSTAINSGIIWRLPEDVRIDWTETYGLGDLMEPKGLERVFEQMETELEVAEVGEDIRGGNSSLMAVGSKALGLPGRAIHRNAARCEGKGQCLQGCPLEARQSMDVSYIPRAIAAGARLHPLARATRVMISGKRAVGVEGELLSEGLGEDGKSRKVTGRFEVRARRGVIVAASTIQTPVLLRKSGLRGMVGDRFQCHPGTAILGRFPDSIGMTFGATQGYEVPMRPRGYKLESLSLPPEMLAVRIPGVGAEWQERLSHMDCYAQWCAVVRMKAHGRVRPAWGGGADVKFTPLQDDLDRTREAMALICRMMFAAGATEVYPGIASRPEILTDVSQVRLIEEGPIERGDIHFMTSHMFGTACAGSDARRSVVGPELESHDVAGLFVMDSSVFPTNLGVNPQHSIMALVWLAAERLANRGRIGGAVGAA